MIADDLSRLRSQAVADSQACAVLVCPPLTSQAWTNGGRRRDFVSTVLAKNHWKSWNEYEEYIALPVLAELLQLRASTGATILPDVTFDRFRQVLAWPRYQLFFLVAHQIPGASQSASSIEFCDGARNWTEVAKTLEESLRRDTASFVFCVCNSYDWIAGLRQQTGISGGGGEGLMPLVQTTRFLRYWIEGLDGTTTVWEARQRALRNHWNPGGGPS